MNSEMDLKHCHDHPLAFIKEEGGGARCSACEEGVEGPSYCCSDCKFYLHKTCAELLSSPEVSHPIHPSHPLILKLESPHHRCNLCREYIVGYRYYCATCDFDLDFKCASVCGKFGELQHSSHEHPFIFIEKHDRIIRADCMGCGEEISSSSCYKCLDCLEVYLHKTCAELLSSPEVNHPIHPPHPLILELESPHHRCNFCRKKIRGYRYHCATCDFDLDIKCASVHGKFGELQHPLHEHPFIFIENHERIIGANCLGCMEEISSSSCYKCLGCLEVYLHKTCAELLSSPEVSHPIHPPHPLILELESPHHRCNLCRKKIKGYRYHCATCDFDLDIKCASVHGKFGELQHPLHEHSFIFIENHERIIGANCLGCMEEISSSSCYKCLDCLEVYLHKTCAELLSSPEVNHPIHPPHPLILKQESPHHRCNLCRKKIRGYRYHCATCDFDLDIKCASVRGNFRKLLHPSHEHPFILIENHDRIVRADCMGCLEKISSSSCYKCLDCLEVYLHKMCAELVSSPEVSHPIHPSHPLILELESPHHRCNLCREDISGFRYRCAPCDFDLDIKCASLHGNFGELQHPSHEHPFIFIENHDRIVIRADCMGCGEEISSSSCYKCLDCLELYLHKTCADLVLSPEVSHPIHPSHPLILKLESRHHRCNLCREDIRGFRYYCAPCDFDLDVKCASVGGNFGKLQHPSHEHPFIFIEKHGRIIRADCMGCVKEISSSSCYKCLDCLEVYLHEECANLSLEIDIFHHRRDLLLQKPPIHSNNCSCYLCKIQWKGFVYGCRVCEFFLTLEEVLSLLEKITSENHEHPWNLLLRQMSFICDFCGTDGDRTPYLCITCNFVVHKNCISLPSTVIITRHDHRLSHSYSLPSNQFEEWKCKICYKEVNKEYGSYYCPASDCNYVAHVHCATHPSIWDPNHEEELSEQESMNWITEVFQRKCLNGEEIAIEIKHAFHDHNLMLTSSDEVKDDSNCDGCMGLISTPFYGCKQCEFYLHKSCAEFPREKRHPSHKHLLALSKNEIDDLLECFACKRPHHGFSYKCKLECSFGIHIQCSLLLDTLSHPSHGHHLFLDYNCQGNCNGCKKRIRSPFAYKCTQGCEEFILDFWCLTLPQIGWYKYDKHPLNLTYDAGSDPDQYYCDICEDERDPNQWFYHCDKCDNSAHLTCTLGELPFIKLGRTYESYHRHQLTFVKNILNCPPCIYCEKLCYGQVLQCTECSLNIHWSCN